MNAIIKKTVKSNSTLCHLIDSLSERLTSKLQWKRFHKYQSAITNSILLSIGDNLFPSITEILEKRNVTMFIFQATIISFSEVDFIQDQEMEEHEKIIIMYR
ncbi:hypothetical protein RhiirC2_769649 [Rhizophagus irregularis]|uniref:Uncharacterized protein n=1 Tax=Rhizophagus irregularis TaxID=588596 RepID=A0A2N1NYE4_9GLOM|nr:hypothetical protein RhiirC2_769649 [Rhizophagus irregularis]